MTEKCEKYLSDILMAIDLIEEFLLEMDFTSYEKDRKTQSAVERQFSIIGEALNQFKKIENSISIENDKQIVAFRNRLVHAYDSLDNSIIWAIVHRNIKPLKAEIENLLKK
ncbi:HepT-like ribonuclease domain-containing protein [Flavobacterium sp. SUN052]|uniref:HepT-like ribonuclease domain-containing protein n=1 Tax=Flavobacterium sp. SUN052 TaxID=3002441 RepID=UPI00237E846A|nr:HepT-like ribonuclease domain-containing protein [Flavobacterium sp. SUN052]MEC4003624.1 HepT-like ribonuclease domain-containing protein [Flavobacterium sp. SUN052]